MLQPLTPSEKAKFAGTALISFALLSLAGSLTYVAYQVGKVQEQLPAFLAQVEDTSQQIVPVLKELDAVRELVGPILKEVAATRELIPPILDEVKAVREAAPGILSEAKAISDSLPGIVAPSAAAVNNAAAAVRSIEPRIPEVLTEVRKTREALPGLLDRADGLIAKASKIGRDAGSNAVTGVFTGIITAPFKLIGQAGKGLAGALGLSSQDSFTAEDEQLVSKASDSAIASGQIGDQQSWYNPKSKNGGSVSVVARETRDGRPCLKMHHRIKLGTGKTHESDVEACQQSDGAWVEVKK